VPKSEPLGDLVDAVAVVEEARGLINSHRPTDTTPIFTPMHLDAYADHGGGHRLQPRRHQRIRFRSAQQFGEKASGGPA
jgi:hypothetical protein